MKFDMHVHTKEGSIDSKVPAEEYARQYMKMGYDGYMIADHNSWRGCKAWDKVCKNPEYEGFTVIRGMEYDTKDCGHVLVILPDGVYPNVLRTRGMKCRRLIAIVHALGGVLGPAHPFGIPASSMMGFKKMQLQWLHHMDFVETFNTCEQPLSNRLGAELANAYQLPGIGGSDCHVTDYIGMAWTEIDYPVHCNKDLIDAIRARAPISAGGEEREDTPKSRAKEHWTGQTAYRIYNRGLGKLLSPRRSYHHLRLGKRTRHKITRGARLLPKKNRRFLPKNDEQRIES